MAYTQVQIIADTDRRHAVKRVNSGNSESSALVVNAAALSFAVAALTTDASANNFEVGEVLTSASGGTATVQDVFSTTLLNVINVVGTFADNDSLTGGTTGRVRQQNGAIARDTYTLHVSRVLYDVTEGNRELVSLLWEGTDGGANNRTIATLSGKGIFEFDTHGARIPNNANSATGNIILTTDNWIANSAYTIVLDASKVTGYAAPYLQRNMLGRY